MSLTGSNTRTPVRCEKCNKILLFKFDDGRLEFVFGKNKQNEKSSGAPVQMEIKGDVKMKCFRKGCNHWNVINSHP